MGGKRLKFPTRAKYVDPKKAITMKQEEEDKEVSDEEHKKRLELLKQLGILKEEKSSE